MCTIGSVAAACHAIWSVRHITSVAVKDESRWGYAIFTLSLAANSIATALLAYKIWAHETRVNAVLSEGSRTVRFSNMVIVKIVLESGMLNAAYLVAYVAILRCGTHGLEILSLMFTPFVGIIFATVILRTTTATQRHLMAASRDARSQASSLQFPQAVRTARSEDMESNTATDAVDVVMDQQSPKVES
ncbi:hypothetical protein BD410DRAFT_776178 [Rickenella mellea]|uniref:Uncharacterized protein n=1 Tax=Rickenella mellea TaxID=50990 RepID=A0A4Y7PPW1_9AGAM|nr:hypothetical protein BD410DRAFT_776178 [Rickenella mellea]